MRKLVLNTTLATLMSLTAVTAVKAQSGAYFTAITNLNPYLYLPLTETTPPPGTLTANNLGTLGSGDDAVYNQGCYSGAAGPVLADTSDPGAYFLVTDNSIVANYDSTYASDTNFTVEFWFNSFDGDPPSSGESIINCIDAASPRAGWQVYTGLDGPGTFDFRSYYGVGSGAGVNYFITVPGGHMLHNTWYHVVFAFASDGTQATVQGYINGQLMTGSGTQTYTTAPVYSGSTSHGLQLGCRSDTSFPFYDGAMADVALYPTVLSSSDISNHYAAAIGNVAGAYNTLVLNDNPQLYFRLNDGTLPVAQNYGTAGSSANGAYQPGTTPASPGPGLPGFGPSGNLAVQFPTGTATLNGATVLVPGAAGLPIGVNDNSPITASAWVMYPAPPGAFATVLGKGDSSYRFDADTSGDPHWNAGDFGDEVYTNNLGDGNWHFWAGTWDGSNWMDFYIDGALVLENSGDAPNTFNNHALDIGAAPDYTGRNFDGGSVAQVAVFPTDLTPDQIANLYFDSGITEVAPIITAQPQDLVVGVGSTATFTVDAVGIGTLSYQWYGPSGKVGTGPTLTISGATASDDGSYYVTVTDSESSPLTTTSAAANLEVVTPVSGTYFAAVAALGPIAYWPLNETNQPSTNTALPETSEPVATNYGVLGTTVNGYYLPGTTPGVPGPGLAGLSSTAVAINSANWVSGSFSGDNGNSGIAGYVDVPDPSSALNDVGPVSVAFWIQAQPNDGRFETALGRGDTSYRVSVDGNNNDLLHFADIGGDLDGNPPAGAINDGNWHFVVGVYDGSAEWLYVDGFANAVGGASGDATGNNNNFTIGEAPDDTGRVLDGNLAHVAIFNYALSASQVTSLYYSAGIAPIITVEPPANLAVVLDSTTNISVSVVGSPTLTYMWSTNNGATLLSGAEFSGTTGPTLTITDAQAKDDGNYVVVVSNAFGAVTSTPTAFTATDAPLLSPPLPATTYALIGTTLSFTETELGIPPFTNVWTVNGVTLTNGTTSSGAIVSGATTPILTIANIQADLAGTYKLSVANGYGNASLSGSVVVDLEPMLRDSAAYAVNNPNTPFGPTPFTPVVSNGVLTMTSTANVVGESTSYWFTEPFYCGGWKVHFVYEHQFITAGGLCFVFQNSAQKTTACGDGGQAFGYSDWPPYTTSAITNSFAFEIDNFAELNATNAASIQTDGIVPTVLGYPASESPGGGSSSNASPEFALGDLGTATSNVPQDFWLNYDGTTMTVSYSNEVTGSTGTYVTNLGPEFVQNAVGHKNVAYMGFTAGTGELDDASGEFTYYEDGDVLTISNFSYTPIVSLTISYSKANGVVINWPTGVGGYELQSTANLASGNWTTLSPAYSTNSGGTEYQYTIGAPTGTEFYRLILPPSP